MTDLVSILIPNYNKAKYLRESLNSVLEQTHQNWECIVVDDHSTDGSWTILEDYSNKDCRFKIYKRPDYLVKGANSCRNYAFKLSNGDLIQFLDSDDKLSENKLKLQILSIDDNTTLSISNWEFFGRRDSNLYLEKYKLNYYPTHQLELISDLWNYQKFVPLFCFLLRREFISDDWKNYIIKNQDGHFLFNIIRSAKNIKFVSCACGYYRIPEKSNVSNNDSFQGYRSEIMVLITYEDVLSSSYNLLALKSGLIKNYISLINRCIDKFPVLAKLAWNRIAFLDPNLKLVNENKRFYKILKIFGFDSSLIMRSTYLSVKRWFL